MSLAPGTVAPVLDYIRDGWIRSVRRSGHDDYPRVFLPNDYTAQSISNQSPELRYWSASFANQALLLDGLVQVAIANAENLFYLVSRLGFVPGSSEITGLTRSEPPCLALVVREIFEHTKDIEWLRSSFSSLRREYDFWMSQRVSTVELNRYGHNASRRELEQFRLAVLAGRIEQPPDDEDFVSAAGHYLAETESGQDFTPRFEGRCLDYVPVDLNSYLYGYEKTLAFMARELGMSNDDEWEHAAENRLLLMRRYLWDESRGIFCDYDAVNDCHSPVLSAVSFLPLCFGIATTTEARATIRTLRPLLLEHGVASCELVETGGRQWGYPNVWAPIQRMAVTALRAYSDPAAEEVALRFVATVSTEFGRSGNLWDKYNGLTGAPGGIERPAIPILGWTAGVFRAFVEEFSLV
jgi:alpha,alpha-trehalase